MTTRLVNQAKFQKTTRQVPVTPSASADLPEGPCMGLLAVSGGSVTYLPLRNLDSETITLVLSAGDYVDCVVRRVTASAATLLADY